MFRLLLRRLSTAAEAAATSSAFPSPSPPLRQPLSANLYSRIAEVGGPHLSLSPVLEQWACEGHTVEKHVLQGIVKKLIGLRRFAHALELSFWMTDQRHFHMSPGDVAYRLELITKVHGLESAVEYFNSIPKELRTHHCYSSLLKCYGEAKAVGDSEELFVKMQEMGMKGVYAYNVMMKLYLETGQLERVHAMFQDMKEKGVKPDTFCMDNLLAAYIAAEDVQGIERLLEKTNPSEKLFSWHAHATAARVFMKSGMPERAVKALLDA